MLALPAVRTLALNEVVLPKVARSPVDVVVPVTERPTSDAKLEDRPAIVEVPLAVIVPLVRV